MTGFSIDEIQAEYVAEIKLRHLNKEYILKRLAEIENLEKSIEEMQEILSSKNGINKIITKELKDVIKKYAIERKSEIVVLTDEHTAEQEEVIPDYAVNLFFTKHGYFKKITPLSLRMGGEQKLKDDDEIIQSIETTNAKELMFFTDKQQVYKSKVSDFNDCKASVLGEYVASKLSMEEGENPIYVVVTDNYEGFMLFFFDNGKLAKVDLKSYYTKANRKKLIKAYSDKSELSSLMHLTDDKDLVIQTITDRYMILNTSMVSTKTMKDTQGVACMTLKKNSKIKLVREYQQGEFTKESRYRPKTLPSAGMILSSDDRMNKLI